MHIERARRHELLLLLLSGAGIGTATADDVQVNTYTVGSQQSASVSRDADGDFVVVWQSAFSPGTDSSGFSIQGQRFSSDASPVGVEFQVNTVTTDWQLSPFVSLDADGDFVVVWHSYDVRSGDSVTDVKAQRYASDGSTVGDEFRVNTYTTGSQWYPSVSMDDDGDFVVVWRKGLFSNGGIRGQRYDSAGFRVGGQFQISKDVTGTQETPSVSLDADGDFVVVWAAGGAPADPTNRSIRGRRYDSNGFALAQEFQVNTYTTDSQHYPSVSSGADGNFVAVWESYGSGGTDSAEYSIQGQRFDSEGSRIGEEFQVNTYTTRSQQRPSVSSDADGDFVVVWTTRDVPAGADVDIRGQRYTSDGSRVGREFQVNTYTTEFQLSPSVSVRADGDFVVVWSSYGSSGTDTSSYSIQRAGISLFADGFESGDTSVWSSGNLAPASRSSKRR